MLSVVFLVVHGLRMFPDQLTTIMRGLMHPDPKMYLSPQDHQVILSDNNLWATIYDEPGCISAEVRSILERIERGLEAL